MPFFMNPRFYTHRGVPLGIG